MIIKHFPRSHSGLWRALIVEPEKFSISLDPFALQRFDCRTIFHHVRLTKLGLFYVKRVSICNVRKL